MEISSSDSTMVEGKVYALIVLILTEADSLVEAFMKVFEYLMVTEIYKNNGLMC